MEVRELDTLVALIEEILRPAPVAPQLEPDNWDDEAMEVLWRELRKAEDSPND